MAMWNYPPLIQCLWDGLMVGVCLVDETGIVRQMNGAGSRLLGWGAMYPSTFGFDQSLTVQDLGRMACLMGRHS